MQFTPYLNFNGTCAEAFRLYEKYLGGTLSIQTHADSPMADQFPPEMADRVMHARLDADGAALMGSDAPLGEEVHGQNVWVSISVEDPAEAERIFAGLAEGGQITMPLDQTFWAIRFGMLVDRFGIPWMVNCEQKA